MPKLKPLFHPWDERGFQADKKVQRMTPTQRSYYRTLLQNAWICETRPYLPHDDDELWLLADAESKEAWLANKEAVEKMFKSFTRFGGRKRYLSHLRVTSDWRRVSTLYELRRKNGQLGGTTTQQRKLASSGAKGVLKQNQPIEVNIFEVKGSKESKPATPSVDPTDATLPSQKELKDRFKIAARDKRLADEHELSVQIHAGEPRRTIGYMSPKEMTSGIRQLLGKEPS